MPRDFAIDTHEFANAARALEDAEFRSLADQTVGGVLSRSSNIVRRHVRAEARPHRRTGKMAGRIRVFRKGVGLDSEFRIRAGGPVAHLVERGFAAHEIVPETARVLVFRGTGRGAQAVRGFAARVRHPGYRGDPFFDRGVEASTDEVQDQFSAGAKTMANNLAFRIRRKR
jgi:hypothetical protein